MKLLFNSTERYLMRTFPNLMEVKMLKAKLEEYKLYRAIGNSLRNVLSKRHIY